MKHCSNILSLRLIFVKKTWRATIKEVIWRHQARSCILKSFWLWFLRSYVRHHLRDSHDQILSVWQNEYRIKIRKLWRMMDIICSRLALSVHVNQSSSSCEVMWRQKKEDGEFFKAMMMCYASFVIRYSAYCHCFSFFELKMLISSTVCSCNWWRKITQNEWTAL